MFGFYNLAGLIKCCLAPLSRECEAADGIQDPLFRHISHTSLCITVTTGCARATAIGTSWVAQIPEPGTAVGTIGEVDQQGLIPLDRLDTAPSAKW